MRLDEILAGFFRQYGVPCQVEGQETEWRGVICPKTTGDPDWGGCDYPMLGETLNGEFLLTAPSQAEFSSGSRIQSLKKRYRVLSVQEIRIGEQLLGRSGVLEALPESGDSEE